MLGGGIESHHRHVVKRDLRGDVDDVAAAGRTQQRDCRTSGIDRGDQVGVHGHGDVLVAGFLDEPDPAGAGRVDQHVHPTELRSHLIEGGAHIGAGRHVGDDRDGVDADGFGDLVKQQLATG